MVGIPHCVATYRRGAHGSHMVEGITAMTTNNVLHIIRVCLTAASAGLTAILVYYPTLYWIPAVVGAIAAISNYVVPSITQTSVPSNLHYPGIPQNPPEQPTNPYKGEQ